jgi:predicted metal-dependent hydrolase
MSVRVDQIIRSKRKTLAVIVKADGSVVVRAPVRVPEKAIREFIENHAEWIEKKQAEVLTFQPPEPKQYRPGELFMYLGNVYSLEIVKGQKKPLVLEENFKLSESAQSKAKLAF